ncbi:MAG: glycosyltransferase family 39 protein [Armatimonadota bacterium]
MYIVLASISLYLLYFAYLGSFPLLDPDEPVYGQYTKEMVASGDWLTPTLNDEVIFDKPPMLKWVAGIFISVLGSTELAMRLPSAIFSVLLVLLVFKIASYDFGRKAGLFSAVAKATCLQQIVLSHAAVTDVILVFFLMASLFAYRLWLDSSGKAKYAWIIVCGVMAGFAMLTKGPVAYIILFGTVFLHLLWIKQLKRLFSLDILLAIITALIVGMPWFIAMYYMHTKEFVEQFIMYHHVDRFLKPEHDDQTGHWYAHLYNIPIFFIFFFPWSVFFPQSLTRFWKENDGARLLFVWIAVVFIFFSLSKTLLVTYIYPLYPAAAVFVGILLSRISYSKINGLKGIKISLWFAFIFAGLILAAFAIISKDQYPELSISAMILSGILVLSSIISIIIVYRLNEEGVGLLPYVFGVGMIFFTLWLMIIIMPEVGNRMSTKELVKSIPVRQGDLFYQFSMRCPSIFFYTDVHAERTWDIELMQKILAGDKRAYVVVKEKDEKFIRVPEAVELVRFKDKLVLASPVVKNKYGELSR